MPDLPTGTVTFLFTDIEGSTRLWEQAPDAMRDALARHHDLVRRAIEAHAGVVFKIVGDGFCAAFVRASDAVAAALSLQQTLLAQAWQKPSPLRVRVALHSGEAWAQEGDYYGATVNRVARLLSAAHGGQIVLSQATAALVGTHLPEDVHLRDLGEHRLKDLTKPEQLFQVSHPSLPSDFPPLRSLESFCHNLPVQLTSFVGREKETAQVKTLLRGTRLLTLTGAGGVGKTRLALQVATEVLEDYPDGVWLAELASLSDPAFVPQAVASVLGIREEPNQTLVVTLTNHLRPKHLLLLLDNCEHLVVACAELAEELLKACPKVAILATSREVLKVAGEAIWRVPSLSLPDPQAISLTRLPLDSLTRYEAVQLFVERAALANPHFALTEENAWSVAQICQHLDGIPLAMELAAARVRMLSVEKISARLDDRFRLLTDGFRRALPRHQTLRAAIEWSYELLSEKEKALFCRLSVFAGGWTLEAAEVVCADAEESMGVGEKKHPHPLILPHEVLDLLTGLVDKSLVIAEGQNGGMRYRLLESLRVYGAEWLGEQRETWRKCHAGYFLTLAEQAEPELRGAQQERGLARLELEHDNLRAALAGALENDPQTGLRLAGALWQFWEVRGHFAEGRSWLEEALKKSHDAPAALRAKALSGAGTMAWLQSDYQQATVFHEEALTLYREVGDESGVAFALNNLGVQATNQGDYERATLLLEESLALYRKQGDRWGIALALNNLGINASEQCNDEQARASFEESLAVSRKMESNSAIVHPPINLGNLAELQEDYERARALHEESLALFRELGYKQGIAASLCNLGEVATDQSDYARAVTLLHESLTLGRELGEKKVVTVCLEVLARVAQAQGQPERAARLWGAAESLREAIGSPLPPADRADYERNVAAARAALGEEAFASAWAAGRGMTVEQAVVYALRET